MHLEFTSWWYENNEKQMISISYLSESNSLEVKIKDLETILIESPTVACGRVLDMWDMFVGSELNILGKFTILKVCDGKTAAWNVKNGKKLLKVREKLMSEIRKYENHPFAQRLLVEYTAELPGGYNLKGLMTQISELQTILSKYRPSLAVQIAGSPNKTT